MAVQIDTSEGLLGFTLLQPKFDRWLASKAEEAGALLILIGDEGMINEQESYQIHLTSPLSSCQSIEE